MRLLIPAIAIFLLPVTAGAADLRQKDVEVYGFNIHYAETGSGPPVILLHGLWGGLNEWSPIIDPLSATHRVIVMDFIGFHGSDKPETQYHNALLSQFLSGFIGALELESVTLLGHAMGANTATYTAVHHPDSIGALILVDGAGYRNPSRDLTEEEMRQIQLPTLIVWGAEDKVFAIENVEKLKADIEGAEAIVIEMSGHLPQIEQTDAFLDAVIPFLNKQQVD